MPPALIAAAEISQLWYLPPLVVAVSLVYGATRHELPWPILVQSYRAARWILTFMAVIFVILLLVSWLV